MAYKIVENVINSTKIWILFWNRYLLV